MKNKVFPALSLAGMIVFSLILIAPPVAVFSALALAGIEARETPSESNATEVAPDPEWKAIHKAQRKQMEQRRIEVQVASLCLHNDLTQLDREKILLLARGVGVMSPSTRQALGPNAMRDIRQAALLCAPHWLSK